MSETKPVLVSAPPPQWLLELHAGGSWAMRISYEGHVVFSHTYLPDETTQQLWQVAASAMAVMQRELREANHKLKLLQEED